MKKPRENALRWFRQAERDLEMARELRERSPADACYFTEQAAQNALKDFLYLQGSRGEPEHSVVSLARRCGEFDPEFKPFVEKGGVLDPFSIPTRYPDALADPAVPFESYSEPQADDGFLFPSQILERVRKKLMA